MSEPLNSILYNALVRAFRQVLISNAGEPYVPATQVSCFRRGRMDSPPLHPGEYYRVSCPFCDDTRQRLYINHMFNVQGDDGDDHLYLAHCFNEECIDSRYHQKKLVDMLFPFGYRERQRLNRTPLPSTEATVPAHSERPVVALPPSFPLQDALSSTACDYLLRRGFEPQEISGYWGVTYCLFAPNSSPKLFQRLLIPVYDYQLAFRSPPVTCLAGWQARVIQSTDSSPKYLSMKGMRKSHLLYGLPQAVNTTGPIIVVEGPTDVWRLGSHAVALFGKAISNCQRQMLDRHFGNRPIVIALDRDAQDEARRIVSSIRESRSGWQDRGPVISCLPPAGAKDFGEVTREAAWAAVESALPRGM